MQKRGVVALILVGLLGAAWVGVDLLRPTSFVRSDVSRDAVDDCLRSLGPRKAHLPPFQFVGLRSAGQQSTRGGGGAVVACYESNDIVCSEMRKHGEFEPDILGLVTSSAHNLRQLVQDALDELRRRLALSNLPSDCLANPAGNDVVYIDIGGNVGVFATEMMRRHFRTYIFEALPANAALLSLGICINTYLRTAAKEPTPLHLLTHVALGPPGSRDKCIALSGVNNLGDAAIDCDPTQVALAKEVQGVIDAGGSAAANKQFNNKQRTMASQLRGFVQLDELDNILAAWNTSSSFGNRAAMQCLGAERIKDYVAAGNSRDRTVPQQLTTTSSAGAAADPLGFTEHFVYRAAPFRVSPSSSTEDLLRFVTHSQVVVKMDVEGFEHNIIQGAHNFLTSTATRPKVIVTEIWRHRDVASYCTRMVRYGYAVFTLHGFPRHWMRFPDECRVFHERMVEEMGTLVFALPGFEHVVPIA